MSAAAVSVRPVASSPAHGDSEGSTSEEDTRQLKSAVVQATSKEPQSPSSSLSRTPSPLPHASFSVLQQDPSPSPPPRPRPRRPRNRSHSPSPPRSRRRSRSPLCKEGRRGEVEEGEVVESEMPQPKKKKEEPDPLFTRTGGAYIPPAKLRLLQSQIKDRSSVAYQRIAWEALKKSINGLINKVNVSNIGNIVQELFQENIVRGRGLLVRSVIQAQAASPTFTHVYAALVAIINTKFPQIGELLAKRLILQFKKGFRRNDKSVCVTASKFIAHLVNQLVLHEIVALELLTLLLEEPTDDSVEVAVGFLKEIGAKLTEISPRGVVAVFETLRSVLHGKQVSSRVQYMIEVMFAVRKDKFQDHPALAEGLDLVQEEDQITHLLSLSDSYDGEEILNVFQEDPEYLANEDKYKEIKAEILGEGSSGSEESSGDESDEEDSEEEGEAEEGGAEGKLDITDKTDAKVLTLRRTIYLTIMSSLDYEECAHKLMKTKEDGQEPEIAMMLVECCSQERSYLRFYGLLGQRFCLLAKEWVEAFDSLFQEQYATVHRLETNKLRNAAKFFAQLFYCDALPWTGMSCIHLNENETNSSSRIFVKILFQELSEFMGVAKLNDRLRDPLLSEAFEGLLPRDDPKNTRFAINFFTSIGLGGLTDDLREHLKDMQKQIMAQKPEVSSSDTSDSDSSSDSSEDESDSEEESSSKSESSSSEEDSEEEERRRRRDKRKRGERERDGQRGGRKEEEKEEKRGELSRRRERDGRRGGRKEEEKEEKRGEQSRRKERGEKRERRRERESSESSAKEDREQSKEKKRERSRGGEREQTRRGGSRDKKHTSREKRDDREHDKSGRRREERRERRKRREGGKESSDSEEEDRRRRVEGGGREDRERREGRGRDREQREEEREGRKRDRDHVGRSEKEREMERQRGERGEHKRNSLSPRDKRRKR